MSHRISLVFIHIQFESGGIPSVTSASFRARRLLLRLTLADDVAALVLDEVRLASWGGAVLGGWVALHAEFGINDHLSSNGDRRVETSALGTIDCNVSSSPLLTPWSGPVASAQRCRQRQRRCGRKTSEEPACRLPMEGQMGPR